MNNETSFNKQNFADIKARIRSAYIPTGRDKKLASFLRGLATNVADWENGVGSKRRTLFLIGASGSGKTRSLEHHFATMLEFQPYENKYGELVFPVLSVDAPRPCNTKALAITILAAMNLPTNGRHSEHELYAMLKHQLCERGVKYLHIDEMQHVIRHNTRAAILHVQDTLKSLIQNTDWPLHTIYSGVPKLAELLNGDDLQLINRSHVLRYQSLSCPDDAAWIKKIIEQVVIDGCDLKLAEDLNMQEFPERLCHAGSGAFGSIIAMVQEACFRALEKGRSSVSLKDFAWVYSRETGCLPQDNVFTDQHWQSIVPGHALADLV